MNGKLKKGFSLLEVMIALLVISVGALGLTKAQIAALQTASDAGLRTIASILVQDMAARIQANAAEALNGNGSGNPQNSGYCLNPTGYACRGTPASNTSCLDATSGNVCTGNQMALQDVYEWQQLITSAFPANSYPQPSISTTNAGIYTVTIFWRSWQSRSSGATCSSASLSVCDQSVTATVTPPLVNIYYGIGGGNMPGGTPTPTPTPTPTSPYGPGCTPLMMKKGLC